MHATQARASALGTKLHNETEAFGAFPIAIVIQLITTLLPMLIKCFQPDPDNAEEHARQYVNKRYTPEKGYDRSLMRRTMFQARRAGRRQNPRLRLDDTQQEEAARITLDEIRLGTGLEPVIREGMATETDNSDD